MSSFFVDTEDTIYVLSQAPVALIISRYGQTMRVNIPGSFIQPNAMFVASDGNIYIDDGQSQQHVQQWSNYSMMSSVMSVSDSCFSLFIDKNNSLYCSVANENIVLTISLNDYSNTTRTAVGNGTCQLASNTLCEPHGIFVTDSFVLYVADTENYRVLAFRSGQSQGITVAGNGSLSNIDIGKPISVYVDILGYLYVVEQLYHKIIRIESNVPRCIAGCSGSSGSQPDQLSDPYQMAFDSSGNLLVLDTFNQRVQNFTLATNSCCKFHASFIFLFVCIFFSLLQSAGIMLKCYMAK